MTAPKPSDLANAKPTHRRRTRRGSRRKRTDPVESIRLEIRKLHAQLYAAERENERLHIELAETRRAFTRGPHD